MKNIKNDLQKVKKASKIISNLSINERNKLIFDIKNILLENIDLIKSANQKDLKKIDKNNFIYDRIYLSTERIISLANSCDKIIKIKDPLEIYENEKIISQNKWLKIKKIAVPLWVIACIYEARPNVTIDIINMWIKSWNAVILRWSSQTKNTNDTLIKLVKNVLKNNKINLNIIYKFSTDKADTEILYNAIWLVDVIIPRWWKDLIENVRKNSQIPVIETWAWVVHLYLDNDISIKNSEKIFEIIINAKTSRPSVCNSLDTLIINKSISKNILKELFIKLKNNWVNLITKNQNFSKEHLSLNLNIKYVNSLEKALNHIEKYSSKHSDWIITDNDEKKEIFFRNVDSWVIYSNTSTRFSDWSCFWFWWEIWISTQKIHSRWPMWAESLVTYKYLVESDFISRN